MPVTPPPPPLNSQDSGLSMPSHDEAAASSMSSPELVNAATIISHNILRDVIQRNIKNRSGLDNEYALEVFRKLNELDQDLNKGIYSIALGGAEWGGASPQVDAMFRNIDPYDEIFDMREALGDRLQIRPLCRGIYGWGLEAKSDTDLERMYEALLECSGPTCLKVFSSQGNLKEVEASVNIVQKLRSQGKPIAIEVAIPYSDGRGVDETKLDFNPYDHTFFVDKIIEAAKHAKTRFSENDHDAYRISLKDMAGELDAEQARLIVKKTLTKLLELGIHVDLGFHLHDAGLAVPTYAAILDEINLFNEQNKANDGFKPFKAHIDTCEGKKTGFASLLRIDEELKNNRDKYTSFAHKNGLEFTDSQRNNLIQQGELTDQLLDAYEYARVNSDALTDEELRKFKIAGGALASFENAVIVQAKISQQFSISNDQAMKVAGQALRVVGKMMGYPFGVTPGFQYKQTAALNVIKNMLKQGLLKEGMSQDQIIKALWELPTHDNAIEILLDGMEEKIMSFLLGPMPLEHHRSNPSPAAAKDLAFLDNVRTQIRQRKPNLKESIDNRKNVGAEKSAEARSLLEKGVLRFSENHIRKIFSDQGKDTLDAVIAELHKHQLLLSHADQSVTIDEKEEYLAKVKAILKKRLGEEACSESTYEKLTNLRISTATGWSLILSGDFEHYLSQYPWFREPDAAAYKKSGKSKNQYLYDLALFQKGLRYQVYDKAGEVLSEFSKGKIPLQDANEYLIQTCELERKTIENQVVELLSKQDLTNLNIDELTTLVFQNQQQQIQNLHIQGKRFFFKDSMRQELAMHYLKKTLTELNITGQEENVDNAYARILRSSVNVPMAAKIKRLNVKPGQRVKKGDTIAIVEAMKMQIPILATEDGVIVDFAKGDKIFKVEQQINAGDVLFRCKADCDAEYEQSISETPLEAILPKEQTQAKDHIQSLHEKTSARLGLLTQQVRNSEEALLKKAQTTEEKTVKNKKGFHSKPLKVNKDAPLIKALNQYHHVIINRGGCAALITNHLEQAGNTVTQFYVAGDETTPIIENSDAQSKRQIASYTSYDAIINEILAMKAEFEFNNPGKEAPLFMIHPGWGFLSEDPEFVKQVEERLKGIAIFAGPGSNIMRDTGNKYLFRERIQNNPKTRELNPKYHLNTLKPIEGKTNLDRLNSYIEVLNDPSQNPEDHPDHKEIQASCKKAHSEEGPSVMNKAAMGGGGKGIEKFTFKNLAELTLLDTIGYLTSVRNQTEYSRQHYNGNEEILSEKCFDGDARHYEVQVGCSNGESIILIDRDCTRQRRGAKFCERSDTIDGELEKNGTKKRLRELAREIAEDLAQDTPDCEGYTSVATIEFMLSPDGQHVMILEVNTRLQVENMVTGLATEQKLNQGIPDDHPNKESLRRSFSLPLYNALLVANQHLPEDERKSPKEILEDVFNISKEEIEEIAQPPEEAIVHYRVYSQEYDLLNGCVNPAYMQDFMFPQWIFEKLHEEFPDVVFDQGGLGDGKCDAQIGAIVGPKSQVHDAVERANQYLCIIQSLSRDQEARTNLPFSLALGKDLEDVKTIWTIDRIMDLDPETRRKLVNVDYDNVMPTGHSINKEQLLHCSKDGPGAFKQVQEAARLAAAGQQIGVC